MTEHATMQNEYIFEAKNVCKLYGAGKQEAARMLASGATKDEVYKETGVIAALWDVNLKIKRGEIFVIIGLSGSGKSTLVRCFNKLNRVTSGEILFDGVNIDSLSQHELLKLRREKISMVFQSFGLMSHRNVLQNVAYGLEVRGEPKETREQTANEIISMVGLDGMQLKSCAQLSGGMRQRVGIARALANSPEVLLMDEPFSALDPLVRRDLQFELLSIQRSLEKTVVFITHDIDEAFRLGDTVAIMQDGRLIQVDTPEKMSANPKTEYVRQFIESANKTKVLTAKNVMVTPSSIMRATDTVDMALNEMRKTGLSSVYTCDDKLRLIGIVTLSDAIRGRQNGLELFEIINRCVITVPPETLLADIIPQAADTPFPVAVTDEQGRLLGLVTKAALLTSVI